MKLSPFSCYFGKSFDVLGLELMSVTCREDAFSSFMGPQQYFSLASGFHLGPIQLLVFNPLRQHGALVLSGERPPRSRI